MRKARICGVCCPWMNSSLSQAMSQCNYLQRRAVKSNSPHLWSCYKKLKNYVNKEIQSAKQSISNTNLITENKRNLSAVHKQSSPISCIEADDVAHCDNPICHQDPKCSLPYNWYKACNEHKILHYLNYHLLLQGLLICQSLFSNESLKSLYVVN